MKQWMFFIIILFNMAVYAAPAHAYEEGTVLEFKEKQKLNKTKSTGLLPFEEVTLPVKEEKKPVLKKSVSAPELSTSKLLPKGSVVNLPGAKEVSGKPAVRKTVSEPKLPKTSEGTVELPKLTSEEQAPKAKAIEIKKETSSRSLKSLFTTAQTEQQSSGKQWVKMPPVLETVYKTHADQLPIDAKSVEAIVDAIIDIELPKSLADQAQLLKQLETINGDYQNLLLEATGENVALSNAAEEIEAMVDWMKSKILLNQIESLIKKRGVADPLRDVLNGDFPTPELIEKALREIINQKELLNEKHTGDFRLLLTLIDKAYSKNADRARNIYRDAVREGDRSAENKELRADAAGKLSTEISIITSKIRGQL